MTGNGRLDLPAVRLECLGLTVRDFFVPPFRVEASQSVCLHVRLPSPKWQEELVPILSGKVAHPAMHLYGAISYLERPMPRRRWWGGWRSPTAGDWLTAVKGLTSAEATAVLSLIGEPADMSVGRIGWNERTMLDLEACLLRPPDLLVFDTCGNDYLGIQRIFERLASRTPQLALVYLKTRFEKEDPCLPGAVCIEMTRAPTHAAIAE
jgi:hypothetical protein